jgi:hypothetical protein
MKPTIETLGKQQIVSFYRHAVERVYERVVYFPETYDGHEHAFASLHDWSRSLVQHWANGHGLGFVVHNECHQHDASGAYVKEVLGENAWAEKRYFYRVGYCPAVISGELLVAKTLLLPGMKGTPERAWYMKTVAKTPSERRRFDTDVLRLTGSKPCTTGDFSLIRLFHDAGIPQVVQVERSEPPTLSPGESLVLAALRNKLDLPSVHSPAGS